MLQRGVERHDLADVAVDVFQRGRRQMRPVGVGRLEGNDDVEAVGERVLRGRPDADVGLHAGDDHPLDPLLAQEQREIRGEEGAVAPLADDDLASARRREPFVERRIGIADEMMARQLPPFVVVETGIVLFDRVNDDMPMGPRLG